MSASPVAAIQPATARTVHDACKALSLLRLLGSVLSPEINKASAGGGDPADAFYDAWRREEDAAT